VTIVINIYCGHGQLKQTLISGFLVLD